VIIKERDSIEPRINELQRLIKFAGSDEQRTRIEQELKMLRSCDKGEKESAYFINFRYGSAKTWALIHDLRLEFDGQVAQIDHLIINRWFDIYVLESKHYSAGIKITPEGEFLVYHRDHYVPIESPIEQNKRHVFLLEKAVENYQIMPTKMGIRIPPKYKSFVLVSPTSQVIRPKKSQFDTHNVIKSDLLLDQIAKEVDNVWLAPTLAKMCTSETLREVATRLSQLHRPSTLDYAKKLGIRTQKEDISADGKGNRPQGRPHQQACFVCGKIVSPRVAEYCQSKWTVFGGKTYCFDCQKLAQKSRHRVAE
jgi:hypothetical protein